MDESTAKTAAPERPRKSIVNIRDPLLLASFTFFDQSHCGYLLEKDMEEVLGLPGLQLSRAQMQKLLQKIATRGSDALNYRCLTEIATPGEEKPWLELGSDEELGQGNWRYLQSQAGAAAGQDGVISSRMAGDTATVTYRGTVINVGEVLNQLERLEKERQAVEAKNSVLDKDLRM